MIPKVGKAISVGQRDPAARWIFQIIGVLGRDSTSWLLFTVIDEGKDVLVRDGKCFDRRMQMANDEGWKVVNVEKRRGGNSGVEGFSAYSKLRGSERIQFSGTNAAH